MKNIITNFLSLISLIILLFTQTSNGQNKLVIQPNFTSPFGQKKKAGNVQIAQPIKPTQSNPVHTFVSPRSR